MNLQLQGKRALVCGSSQGIGKFAALQLAEAGAEVVLFARNRQLLEETTGCLNRSAGQKHNFLVADFSNPDEVMKVLRQFLSESAPVNILVNNTGGPPPGPAHQASEDEYLSAFRAHLINNQNLVSLTLEGMKSSGYGRIINIISTSVKQPIPGLGVSNTIRGAVASWSKSLSAELGPFGITVNNVLPGATETARLHHIMENKARKMGITVEEAVKKEQAAIPLRRFAKPEETACAVAFLASPSAAYISGVSLPVDGGRTGCL